MKCDISLLLFLQLIIYYRVSFFLLCYNFTRYHRIASNKRPRRLLNIETVRYTGY